jgi:integrase
MGLYKRGKVWWLTITRDGKRFHISTKTTDKQKAQEVYAEVLLRLTGKNSATGVTDKPTESGLTYQEFYENHYLPWCMGRHASYEKTKKYFLNAVPEWFRKLRLCEISMKEVESYQSYLIRKGLKVDTCNKYLSLLKASFTKACEWELITEERLKAIRKVKLLKGEVKRLRYLNPDEIRKLLEACDSYLYPVVFTALNTGMRRGELLNLRWKDVDLKNGLILLEKTKNQERREIPMNEALKELFRRLFTQRRLDTDYVFPNPQTGNRFYDLKRAFQRALRKAGIRDFRFHDLRHTFASQLVMAGVDIRTVQELLGHKKLSMTMRYSHLSQAHKKEAVQTLEKVILGENRHQSVTKVLQFTN